MKKLFALVLCLVLVLAGMPVGAEGEHNVAINLPEGISMPDGQTGPYDVYKGETKYASLSAFGDNAVDAEGTFTLNIIPEAEVIVNYSTDGGTTYDPLPQSGAIILTGINSNQTIDLQIYKEFDVAFSVGANGLVRIDATDYTSAGSPYTLTMRDYERLDIGIYPNEGYDVDYTRDGNGENGAIYEENGTKLVAIENLSQNTTLGFTFNELPPQQITVTPVYKDTMGDDLTIEAHAIDGNTDNFRILMDTTVVANLPEGRNNDPGNVSFEGGYNLQIEVSAGYAAKYKISASDPTYNDLTGWTDVTGTSISLSGIDANTNLYIVFFESQEPVLDDPINININLEGPGSLQVNYPQGSTYTDGRVTIERGDDLELRLLPDEGYNVVGASANGVDIRNQVSGENTLRIDNISGDMNMTIRFGTDGGGEPGDGPQPPPMEPFDLTINRPTNGTVYYYEAPDSESLTELTAASVLFEQLEQSMIIYLKPNVGYKVAAVQNLSAGMTAREDCSYLLSYDPNVMLNDEQGLVAVPLEFWDDTEVFFEFSPFTAADMTGIQLAILSSENTDDAAAKQAIRRELGFYGFDIPVSSISVSPAADQTSDNGVPYKTRSFTAIGFTSTVYIVDHVSNGVFVSNGTYSDGTSGRKVYIYVADDLNTALWGNQNFSVQPIVTGTLDLYGPYNLRYYGTFSEDTADAFTMVENYRMDISRYFGRAALHIGNGANESILDDRSLGVNWYMMTLVQEDALAVQINTGAAIGGFQGAHSLDLDNVADLSSGDTEINMFFGNDTVYVDRPMNDAGDIETMTTPEIDHPGYTIRMVNGSIEVFFKSNFYDRLTIPITITRQDGTVVVRNLTIIRTGVEFEHFISSQSDPASPTANVGHGTQRGSEINLRGEDSYFVVASYLIPDFGDTLPYGLLVTRTYDDGTSETEIVRNPIDSPPDFFMALDYDNGIYYYNNGVPGEDDGPVETNANVADYMVFAGDENGRVPKTINVLVLKADPASVSTGSFGGFFFGSGSGVEWDRPN